MPLDKFTSFHYYTMFNHIRLYLQTIARAVYAQSQRDFICRLPDSKHNMLVAYMSAPFFKQGDAHYMLQHQNRRETLLLADELRKLNISHRFINYCKPHYCLRSYDIFFGLEPIIDRATKRHRSSLKIYYATGAYCHYQNRMVKQRTDEFNRAKGTNVPYLRMTSIHTSCENADYIIQIGSKFTLETYPQELRHKVIFVRQTCNQFHFSDFMQRKLQSFNRNEFVWMGSKGSLLKGLDLVLDAFIANPQYTLHVVGNIDNAVMSHYTPLITNAPNIILHGFCDLNSPEIEQIALRSVAVIMPSASEGCPGAVINCMKLGCIPIVSRVASFDEIDTYGLQLPQLTVAAVISAVNKLQQQPDSELQHLMSSNYEFANQNWNETNFRADFRLALTKILTHTAQ